MTNALTMHPNDDVAVVTAAVSKGDDVTYVCNGEAVTVTARDDIPIYHKIAVRPVNKSDAVRKYGEMIGRATADIALGSHIHTHNLSDLAGKAGDET